MTKRLFSMLLVCVMLITACLTAIPTFEAFATFKNGDVVIITECAGGGVSPEGVVGTDYPTYFVSAMKTTNAEKTASYFAWCASYTVNVPSVDREYILYDHENAESVVVDGKRYNLVNYNDDTGHYEYFDTGLNGYIDFNWALSCIKAAEHLAGTTELPFDWRMAVELAIRSNIINAKDNSNSGFNLDVAINSNSNLFGDGIKNYLKGEDCNSVAEFLARAKAIATHAKDNPIVWEPYIEEIAFVESLENFYRGNDFILFEGKLNKSNCELTVYDTYPDVEVNLNGIY